MQECVAIGIDLGGTNCRAGVVDRSGHMAGQVSRRVPRARSAAAIPDFLVSIINELRSSPAIAVGIGAPGIVGFSDGIVYKSPHFPEWHDFNLRDRLSEKIGLPVVVDNDANAIAAGESWKGAGAGLMNFIMLTFGTGIGGAIVINGGVFRGDGGFAGEVGHMVIQFDGPSCPCGGAGCWELYASESGLQRKGEQLYRLAKEGDASALAAWNKFGSYVGAGVASLVNVLGIYNVVIGGGLASAWDFFIGETERTMRARLYAETAKRVVLKRAALGDAAGIIGAARIAMDHEVSENLTGA